MGPTNQLTFRPESLAVAVGEDVTWKFVAPGHNVSCNTDHSDEAALPDEAEPFASYEGDDKYRVEPEGVTFFHTFTTPGTYVYVCVPHIRSGMIGEITVTE